MNNNNNNSIIAWILLKNVSPECNIQVACHIAHAGNTALAHAQKLPVSPAVWFQQTFRNAKNRGPGKAGSHSPLLLNPSTPASPTVIKDKSRLSKHLLNHAAGGRRFMLSPEVLLNSTPLPPFFCSWIHPVTLSLTYPSAANLALPAPFPPGRDCWSTCPLSSLPFKFFLWSVLSWEYEILEKEPS